jgi:hypothetical protein
MLLQGVRANGARRWSQIAALLPGRRAKQCRERWHNHLDPTVCKDPWTTAEDIALQSGVYELGHKWAQIAKRIPGRTDNQVKNRYNQFLNSATSNPFDPRKCIKPVLEPPKLDDATLLLELQRRNADTDVPHKRRLSTAAQDEIKNGQVVPWSFEEELRLAAAVQMERKRLRVGEAGGWTGLRDQSWTAVAHLVKTRTPMACRRHWSVFVNAGLFADTKTPGDVVMAVAGAAAGAAPEVAPEMESFAFDEVIAGCEYDQEEAQLLCFEEYDEGRDVPLMVRSMYITALGPDLDNPTRSINFRFPPDPRYIHRKPKGKRGTLSKRDSLAETASVKDYYPEAKRRAEAEAEAWGKNVFA